MADTNPTEWLPPFARDLGVDLTLRAPDEVACTMRVEARHANRNGVMHGGAILGFADVLGGAAAASCLAAGEMTTTMESKSNFLRPIEIGDRITGHCVPLHKGRRTTVWQTTVTRGDGKVAAIVTQTQMTLPRDG